MVSKKIQIIVSEYSFDGKRNRFYESVKDKPSREFTRVDFGASKYGGGSPCCTPEEIKSAIKNARETIIREGDIPVLKDERENLKRWF